MPQTTKHLSERDAAQTQQLAFNDVDASVTIGGFLTGKLGRKIVQTISTTTVTGDTAVFDFQENGISLYQFTLIYTDNSQATLISAERTA